MHFRSAERRFLKPSFHRFDNAAVVKLLTDEGISTETRENGRVFPMYGNAKDVMRVFNGLLQRAHVQLRIHTQVSGILAENGAVTGVEDRRRRSSLRITSFWRQVGLPIRGPEQPGTAIAGHQLLAIPLFRFVRRLLRSWCSLPFHVIGRGSPSVIAVSPRCSVAGVSLPGTGICSSPTKDSPVRVHWRSAERQREPPKTVRLTIVLDLFPGSEFEELDRTGRRRHPCQQTADHWKGRGCLASQSAGRAVPRADRCGSVRRAVMCSRVRCGGPSCTD